MRLNIDYDDTELFDIAVKFQVKYPEFIAVYPVTQSLDLRDILLIRVGFGEKNIILSAGVHGRESINPVVLMAMIDFYGEHVKKNSRAGFRCMNTKLMQFFEEYKLYIFPLLNPDGYMIARKGPSVIRNKELRQLVKKRSRPYRMWKENARGIDLNRNFPCKSWSEKFPEDYPGSEPETRILMETFDELQSELYIDYHSRGNEIYYYRNQMSKEYNEQQLIIANRLAKITGYSLIEPTKEIEFNDTGGNTVHYFSETYNGAAITIETAPEETTFPMNVCLQGRVFEDIIYTPMAAVGVIG